MARENSRTTPPQQSRDAADSSRSRPPGSRRSPGDYTAITEPARAPTKALHPAAAPAPPTPIAEIAFALTGVVITSALMAAALAVFIRRRIRRRQDDPFHVHQRSMHSRLLLLGAMLRHILTRRSSRRHASSTVSAQPSTDWNLHDVTVDDTDTPAPLPDEASSSQSGRSGPSTLHADEETSSSDGPASSQLTEPPGPSSQAAIPAQRSVHDSGAHASSDAWLPCELANPYGSVSAADAQGALSRSQKLPEDSAENSPQRAVPSPGRGEGLEHGPPEPHARVHIRVLCQQLEPPQPQSPMARHPPTPQARSVTREATASSGAPCSHLATPEIVAAAIPLADADNSTQHASAPAHQRVLAGHSRISCEVLPLPAAGGDPLAQPTPLATPARAPRQLPAMPTQHASICGSPGPADAASPPVMAPCMLLGAEERAEAQVATGVSSLQSPAMSSPGTALDSMRAAAGSPVLMLPPQQAHSAHSMTRGACSPVALRLMRSSDDGGSPV